MRARSQKQIEAAAEMLHASWVVRLQMRGVESRLSHWGEELMRPWHELSAEAKEYNRDAIRDLDAIDELLDVDERDG